jgi:predicted nucleic acid-binding protein
MSIVVDANLIVVLVSGDPRGDAVANQLRAWINQNISLRAPYLAQYEIANALTRAIVANLFDPSALSDAWTQISNLPITYHSCTDGTAVIQIARSLKRQNAYDAAYLELAQTLNAELWTLDSPLYRNAVSLGFPVKILNQLPDS